MEKPSTFKSLAMALRSWRTASVVLLSFSSGLPLGLVWIAIPDWLRDTGMDIRLVGLITLAQVPWSFKFLWSPFMDRYIPPWLGRRRGWIAIAQVALFALSLSLAGLGDHPDTPWVIVALAFAIAFASATQDIAIDAYTVDVLRKEEQGVAAGARIAVYRAAMYVAGGLSITLAGSYSWPAVNAALGFLYVLLMYVTIKAPEPEEKQKPPVSMKEAVWYPFLGFLSRHRALEILAFVIFYKLADNLAGALLRPFLVDMGYSDFDRGFALATIGLFATLAGTFLGGVLTTILGLGHSLWFFGFLQILSNIGYVLVSTSGLNRPLMYGAMGFESLTQGLGTGAFSVLLLRMTQKRFSATQYALFSSLFGLPRILAGPLTGFMVNAIGWTTFFWISMAFGLPGLILLSRFVPLGTREPEFEVLPPTQQKPLTSAQLALRGLIGAIVGFVFAAGFLALMSYLRTLRDKPPIVFNKWWELFQFLQPQSATGWITIIGLVVFAIIAGLFTAAVYAAKSGAGAKLENSRNRER